MERCESGSVLLGYNLQRPFVNSPSSSPKSQCRNSDIDFNDVFGGPPRRYSPKDARHSFAETTESDASRSDGDADLNGRSLGDKPVFGDEGLSRRQNPVNDFFDDIFRGNESLSSSPKKSDRDSFSVTSGSYLSPARPLSPRTEAYGSPAQFSLPAKLIKGTDLPVFGSSTRYYSASPLSRSSSQKCPAREVLRTDVYGQRSASPEISWISTEESSSSTKSDGADKGRNLEEGSNTSEVLPNGGKFHFSIYKWASKGVTVPLRGGNNSRQLDKCKPERYGWIACEGMARELPNTASNEIDIPSFSSRLPSDDMPFMIELDKQEDDFLCDTTTQGTVEHCQTMKEKTFIFQNITQDTKSNSVAGMGLSEKTDQKVSAVAQEGPKAEKKTLRTLLFDKEHKQDADESSRKNGLKESRVKNTRKLSAVFDVSEEVEKQDEKATTLKSDEVDKPSLLFDKEHKQDADESSRKNGLKESRVKNTRKLSAFFDVSEKLEKQDEKATTLKSEEVDKPSCQGSPIDTQVNTGKNRVRGKVKEFVKIFNQEVPNKPKFGVESQNQSFKWKERSKFRKGDEISPQENSATTIINGKKHLPNGNRINTPVDYTMVDEYMKHSEKQHHEPRTMSHESINISSQFKHSAGPTLETIVGDAEEADQWNFVITELLHGEEKLAEIGNISHEEMQAIDGKIRKWSSGKEGNIRSLLSTLQYVLWPESGWKTVPLVDIIEGNAVKRSYQKALLCLHPDKLQQKGAAFDQKYVAEKVFDILQDAWAHFNTLGPL